MVNQLKTSLTTDLYKETQRWTNRVIDSGLLGADEVRKPLIQAELITHGELSTTLANFQRMQKAAANRETFTKGDGSLGDRTADFLTTSIKDLDGLNGTATTLSKVQKFGQLQTIQGQLERLSQERIELSKTDTKSHDVPLAISVFGAANLAPAAGAIARQPDARQQDHR